MNTQLNTKTLTWPVPKLAQSDARYVYIPVLSNNTSVSLKRELYAEALRLAGGDSTRVYAVVRESALEIALSDAKRKASAEAGASTEPTEKRTTFSARVRAKAIAKLRGAYRPAIARKSDDSPAPAEVALAAENNKAWGA